ncbi:pentatricopeptide repeat-containing protein-like isoform X1, mitochondrial [Iris pallida]|uniref:Pentatricopeptide repeat-containing protein-like isoform X1, mitochondrial n=1 Tax=Iris pallida TaxID=29817 RepID=A0AAX6IID5_IRIPA|nr:pentatricopeptide repeat-containing protein-like isoform X1, mitochondrial [Iris pallida]
MEQVLEKMRDEGMEPDIVVQGMVVDYYFVGGLKEKAEAALKEMEGYDLKKNREVCKVLLRLYATLGKVDDLERVWKVCEDNDLRFGEGLVAIEAWGKVGHVEKAEDVFGKLATANEKLSAKYYDALLWVYAEHNLLSKGEALVERMKDNGCYIGPPTLGALVKLYVKAGAVEKADDMLRKARKEKKIKAPFMCFLILLEEYSKRGDVQNAERMFSMLRKAGYKSMKLYTLLLRAYLNGKIPAYGFGERMKADGVFPNKQVAELLAKMTSNLWTTKDSMLDDSITTEISKPKAKTLSQIFSSGQSSWASKSGLNSKSS